MPIEHNGAFRQSLEQGLSELEARSQRRCLAEIAGVNLCSNDYLGLAEHPALREAIVQAVQQAPRVGGTGSRLLSGHAAAWESMEQEFAAFAGAEAALYFSSGYTANIGVLTSLMTKSDMVFSDELNHASLIDGIRLSGARKVIYPHMDMNALEAALRVSQHGDARRFVITETVFSMDGDIVPLRELLVLCEKYGAIPIFDEAHATGVHGPSGRGISANADFGDFVVVHTCGKAFASPGAFVCGSMALREHLMNHARTFIFTTATPPYIAGQIHAALQLARGMDARRAELLSCSHSLAAGLRSLGFDTAGSSTQIVPLVVGGNEETLALAEYLQQRGFAVRAIRPPTVKEGRARLRLSITAAIPQAELNRLEETLGMWRAQHATLSAAGCA